MQYLNTVDWVVIVVYFSFLVGLGFFLQKLASASLEDYFVGGRRLPWWALGVSGMASFLDVTGTMLIVSFIFMLGIRGLFIEFRGGAVLVLPFMLLWAGKWHRRSQCLTNAEWNLFRFGDGFGGRFAQFAAVLAGVISCIGMLAYLIKGIGLFLATFLPFSPFVCALLMVSVATLYTMVSGFYGVVFTDMVQSAIILIAVVGVSVMAMTKIGGDPAGFGELARSVSGNKDWMTTMPGWVTTMPDNKNYQPYQHLLLFASFYFLKNVVAGMGAGGDPKYFGARSDRECGLLTFLWTWLMAVRWPMIMAFAVLGIYLVRDLFPDQGAIAQAADLIRTHFGGIDEKAWGGTVSTIVNNPGAQSPDLIAGLKEILGADHWGDKLKLVSFHGTINPELVLPSVLLFDVLPGFRGLILIALIAASMSTFDSTVNMTTGLITRDVYQKYLRPQASTKELVGASWIFVLLLVILSFVMGYSVRTINDIWGWIIMGLGGGLMIPGMLKFYWWRFNGGGFAVGTIVGITAAVVQRACWPDLSEIYQFLILGSTGFAGTVLGTYLTRPTDPAVLENFFVKTRPFGVWKKLHHLLPEPQLQRMKEEHKYDLLALPFNLLWQVTLFILPMQFIIQAWSSMIPTAILFLIGLGGMYWFWYRKLPAADAG